MIDFRCWYCDKRYWKPEAKTGERFLCTCGQVLKVPRRSGRSPKVFRVTDFLIEATVYGGGGALLGFGLAVLIATRLPFFRRSAELIAGLTLFGFLFGLLGGERGVNFVGRLIRDREQS